MALDAENLRRWRLILGADAAVEIPTALSTDDAAMERALGALYDADRKGGLGPSSPNVARWLGDIRTYFPASVVQVMQQDALERLNLKQMLLEPEMLESVEPNVHLVASLVSLAAVIPARTRETARIVVKKVCDALLEKLANPMRQAVNGSLNRAVRNRRPKHNEIDWPRTVRANLKHYQEKYGTIIPETRIGAGRKKSQLRDIVLCVDQSGSMATSVVYASIFSAVLASLPAVRTAMALFDTAVVDMTDQLADPVELLFGARLGGGTDINAGLSYCQSLVRVPTDTVMVLISDLYDGGVAAETVKRAASIVASGVTLVVLLALSDDGAPAYSHPMAGALADLGISSFACTPDLFPDLMAAAIAREDVSAWAATRGIAPVARAGPHY